MKKYNLILFVCVTIFASCNSSQNEEFSDLQNLLDNLIQQQYSFLKNIDSHQNRDFVIDSLCFDKQQLLNTVNQKEFENLYIQFNKKYGDNIFDLDSKNKNYLQLQLLLIEYFALNQEIIYYYQSHYQVDAMGFIALDDQIGQGEKKKIRIVPYYMNLEIKEHPLIIVANDTLEYDNGIYYYDAYTENEDFYDIEGNIIVWKWDRYSRISASCRLNIKD